MSKFVQYNGLTIPADGPLSSTSLYQLDADVRLRMRDDALQYYRVAGRHYHDQRHPVNMLNTHLDIFGHHPTDDLFLAVIMHDAVYVPSYSPDSEDMSARLVPSLYYRHTGTRIPLPLCDKVFALIRWTIVKYHVRDNRPNFSSSSLNEMRMLDLDLITMSSDWTMFVDVQYRIAKEFEHLSSMVEAMVGGAKFLRGFIERGFIYYSPEMSVLDFKAMRNLKAYVQAVTVHKEFSWEFMKARDPDYLAYEYHP